MDTNIMHGRTIYSLIKDPKILKYLDDVIKILETIQEIANAGIKEYSDLDVEEMKFYSRPWTNEHLNYQIEFLIFGGLVRDVAQGLDYELLVQKDIDVYIRPIFLKANHYLSCETLRVLFGIISAVTKDLHPDASIQYQFKGPVEESYFTLDYDLMKIEIPICEGRSIKIDIASDFHFQDYGRFESVLDFSCNALYFPIGTGIINARTKYVSIEQCFGDIRAKKLVPFFDLNPHPDTNRQDMKKREVKLLNSGYSY